MAEKKKAQVSIEILVILGLLVVGAVIFSAYYVSNLQHKVGTSATTQGAYADISENIKTEDPQQLPEECGDTQCNGSETCSTCPQDCLCPEQINLLVYPDPNISTPQGAVDHKTFGIKAEASNYSDGQLYIKVFLYQIRMKTPQINVIMVVLKYHLRIDNLNIQMSANGPNYSVLLKIFLYRIWEVYI